MKSQIVINADIAKAKEINATIEELKQELECTYIDWINFVFFGSVRSTSGPIRLILTL